MRVPKALISCAPSGKSLHLSETQPSHPPSAQEAEHYSG